MDRRKFMGAAAAGTGVAALDDKRLFGKPHSVASVGERVVAPHLLKLHMQMEGVPKEQYPSWLAFTQLADDVIMNSDAAISFSSDPEGYMTAAGFPHVTFDRDSHEFRVVAGLANPVVRTAARSGDKSHF